MTVTVQPISLFSDALLLEPVTVSVFIITGAPAETLRLYTGASARLSTFFANPGDFDGDGKYDFCLQRADPGNPAQGQFVLLNSSNSCFQVVNWGGPNDFIIPGDYDADGRSDFMIRRSGTSPYQWYLLESDGGGTGASPIFWGIPGDEFAPGDYDGDGKTDVAVRRPDPVAANNLFYVLRSTGGFSGFQWGLASDVATASWNVH